MKQSSTEPCKKKLVQARLPFQILSPGVKSPEVNPSELRKRKANEDGEVTDVKENHAAPVEKKPKVAVKDVGEEKTSQNSKRVEDGEEEMEVEDEVKSEGCTPANQTPAPKGKCKSDTSQNSKRKSKKLSHIGTAIEKMIVQTKKESINKSRCSESAIVDCIDLCDSPIKTENPSEDPSHTDIPIFTVDSSCTSVKEQKEDKLNIEIIEESNEKPNKISQDQHSKEKSEYDNLKGDIDSESNTISAIKTKQSVASEGKSNNNSEQHDTLQNKSKTDLQSYIEQASLTPTVTSDSNSMEPPECKKDKDSSSSSLEPKTPSRQSQSSIDELVSRLNESSTSFDMSSDCTTPSAITDTPKAGKKRASSTPRRLTPKQLLKMKEKEEKLKEKERLKQEKERKKAEEREEKQKLKQVKEEEKLKQKQEKEEEKRKEKEEKERKKQAEIAQKNEEKRLKEEEKRLKEEEKRAKDDEKKKKDEEDRKKKEEKRLKEEQKAEEKRKSAQAFASFFVKPETKQGNEDEESENPLECSKFQPFEVKNDMRLAPLVRCQLTQDRRQVLDSLFSGSLGKAAQTYLKELQKPSYIKGSAGKTWPATDDMDDDVIIIEAENPNGEMESDRREHEKKSEKKRHRAKLLQFHENRRPPYWGTWRKKSKFIRPRAPHNEDKTMFEYDIDSDDEWEEPEDGESLRGSENEESQDEQYEEDNDMFVPHGYLSDEEGQDDLDDKSPETMKAKLKFLQLEFEAERNEKQEKLKPRLVGCVWFCNTDAEPSTVGSHIAELFLSRRAVWDSSPLPVKLAPPAPPTPPTPSETREKEESRGTKKKHVPESMIPTIIRAVHGSRKKLTKLIVEVLNPCDPDQRPSKRCFVDKVQEIATWKKCTETGHFCWYVNEEVRQAYNLMDLHISPPRVPSTPNVNITKFTKVLTSDERLRLLSSAKESFKSPSPSLNQTAECMKNVTPKTPSLAKTSPVVRKRILFTTVGPVQGCNSLRNFVSVKSKGQNVPDSQTSDAVKSNDKVIKRITPITLTSTVKKSPPASEDGCVVLSD